LKTGGGSGGIGPALHQAGACPEAGCPPRLLRGVVSECSTGRGVRITLFMAMAARPRATIDRRARHTSPICGASPEAEAGLRPAASQPLGRSQAENRHCDAERRSGPRRGWRAERKAGVLLKEMDKNEGGPERRVLSSSVTALPPPTLPQLGITRNQSSAWQRIAAIPATDFEEHVDATKAAGGGRAEPHADKPGRDGGGGVEGNPVGIRRGFGEARTRSDAGVLGRGVVDRADTWPLRAHLIIVSTIHD